MIRNYIKTAYRQLMKNIGFTTVNILGLSAGLTVCLLIGVYLHYEYNFDRSNPEFNRTYRLLTTFKYPNSPESTLNLSSLRMGPYLASQCTEIERFLRVISGDEDMLCKAEGKEVAIGKSLQVDSSFFAFFNYPLLYGNIETAFSRPENILLSRKVAEILFDGKDPVGKTISHQYTLYTGKDTTIHFIVSGVLADLPPNSHLQFDALLPLDLRQYDSWSDNNTWHGVVADTYFQLYPGANNGTAVAATFPEILKKEMPSSQMVGLALQPFAAIHTGSMHLMPDENNYQKSDRRYLGILGLVGLFILLISSINFANLSTVLALKRGQEIGVRKSFGASKGDVLRYFLGEALLMAVLAGGLALLWSEMLRKPFFALLGIETAVPFPPVTGLAFGAVVMLLGLVSGIYPAIQAARYSALQAFQQKNTAVSVKRPFVQRLVVVQFVLSGILIIGALICYQQLHFLKNKDLGFQYAQVVEMDLGPGNWMRSPAMKTAIAAIPGVQGVSSSDASLGTMGGQNGVMVRNTETRNWENFPMTIIRADEHYFDLYEMKFIAGRAPTAQGAANEQEYVVNEAFLKKVGWKDDPIGKEIIRAGLEPEKSGRIVGVIQDIHHNTLRHAIAPICIQAAELSSVISMKIEPANMSATLKKVSEIWAAHISDRPFNYRFLDEHFAEIYKTEEQLGKTLLYATFLSILIACLGLLALSAFIISQRTKEIGIRKVLGASVVGITGLLAKDFLKLVLIAICIASPIAYYFMNKWLADFAYRIQIQWWMFVLAGLLALLVAFLTVGGQAIKAALANPVKSLRSE